LKEENEMTKEERAKQREEHQERINEAFTSAVEELMGAVAGGAGSLSNQATTGGAGGTTGQTTQGAAGEIKTKDDVVEPELISSLNAQFLGDNAKYDKINVRTFDAASAALSMGVLAASQNHAVIQQQTVDHRDLAHDRQWNVNETDMYATIAATVIAKTLAQLGLKTPTE
jgi:hypothetical protein